MKVSDEKAAPQQPEPEKLERFTSQRKAAIIVAWSRVDLRSEILAGG